ncbi:MAG: hypothetical protein WDO13_09965 [Verrucomicrobiota bacterium]
MVNSEEFSGGGLGTVRGYLESEELGDNAICTTLELRSPSLGDFIGKAVDEWRFYIFGDFGLLTIDDPLPEQDAKFQARQRRRRHAGAPRQTLQRFARRRHPARQRRQHQCLRAPLDLSRLGRILIYETPSAPPAPAAADVRRHRHRPCLVE